MSKNCDYCKSEFLPRTKSHRFCSRSCQQSLDLEERRKKRSGGPGKNWSLGKSFVPRKTCQICGVEFYAPPILMRRGGGKFCSKTCHGYYIAKHPDRWPQTSNRRGKGGKREDLGGIYFRSCWEANWARYLNWLVSIGDVVSWTYEPEVFEFKEIKRGCKFYTPDFLVVNKDGSREYHEIKGYMDQRSATKIDRMRRYYPEVKLIVVDKKYYRDVAKKVGDWIVGWETVKGKAFQSD